jgi:hypothetical protein
MGNFRFYKRVNIFPGLSVNLSKSGPSLTVGMRGAHMTFGGRGVTRTVGIPGSGIYYTSRSGYHSGVHSAHAETPLDPGRQAAADRADGCGMLAIVLLIVLAIGIAIGASSHG